jgi:hypothetical protein
MVLICHDGKRLSIAKRALDKEFKTTKFSEGNWFQRRKQMADKEMTIFEATMIAEGVDEASEEKQTEAWQMLIDTGMCWKLQGFFGRTAQSLIEAGICSPAKK